MTTSSFMKLVEIRTKVASVIPFIVGSLYALYAFESFDIINALLMFASMFIFDMTTTAINNYIDYVRALQKHGYGYEIHNAIGAHGLDTKQVRHIIYIMLGISALLGILLVMRTNKIVLILGMISFAIGIAYTFGPLPISRTPFGELFSGVAMGLILTFISIYVHIFDKNILTFDIMNGIASITLVIKPLINIFLVCLPLMCCIANIMLANNLCDVREDIVNKRYTLPVYIGNPKGVRLWCTLYYVSYLAIIICVVLKILPITALLVLLTLPAVHRNMAIFKERQIKRETFACSIKNFMLFNSYYIISLMAGLLIKYVI